MSGINRKTFYCKGDTDSDAESTELRWGPKKFISSAVIPPTEPSEAPSTSTCLSPPSKFSSANGSVTTSPEDPKKGSLVNSFAKPIISTRFTKALLKTNKLSKYYIAPADPGRITPLKKCSTWVKQAQLGSLGGASKQNSAIRLVDYSPTSSASSCPSGKENNVPSGKEKNVSIGKEKNVSIGKENNVSSGQEINGSIGKEIDGSIAKENNGSIGKENNGGSNRICSKISPSAARCLSRHPPKDMTGLEYDVEPGPPRIYLPNILLGPVDDVDVSWECLKDFLNATATEGDFTQSGSSVVKRFEPSPCQEKCFDVEVTSVAVAQFFCSLSPLSFNDMKLDVRHEFIVQRKAPEIVEPEGFKRKLFASEDQAVKPQPKDKRKRLGTGQAQTTPKNVASNAMASKTALLGCPKGPDSEVPDMDAEASEAFDLNDQEPQPKHNLKEGRKRLGVSAQAYTTPKSAALTARPSRTLPGCSKDDLSPYARLRLENLKKNSDFFKTKFNIDMPIADTTQNNKQSSSSESDSDQSGSEFEAPSSRSSSSEGDSSNKNRTLKPSTGSKTKLSGSVLLFSRPPTSSRAGSDSEIPDMNADLSEALSDGDLNDHEQAALQKPQPKYTLKHKRKQLRNSGQAYTTPKDITVPARSSRAIHACRKFKCNQIISKENADKLCAEFWELSDINLHRKYIAARISYEIPKRRRSALNSDKERVAQFLYHVDLDGVRHRVCKSTFLDIFCLSEKMVRSVTDDMVRRGCNVPANSLRGIHAPKHKLSAEVEAAIKQHIDSFPSYVSHYSRAQNQSFYFPCNLKVNMMYDLYLEGGNPPVSFSTYYTRVKLSGRKFKTRSFSTCDTCDQLKLKIEAATDEEEIKSLTTERERHHRKAEQAYKIKRKMKFEAEQDPTLRVLVYDMEKVLPCPFLKNKSSFYLRQLNVFNITVTDTSSKLTHNYMWHEIEGGRSANAIASCLLRHILNEVPNTVTRLVLFSDACTSQNRNSRVSAMYHVALQEHPSLQSIEHIFLIPGHTHLEVDNKHSVIERFKNNKDKICHPDEYYSMVEEAGKADKKFPNGKFFVVKMHKNFYDFAHLLTGPLIKREVTVSGNSFKWLSTNWFKYSKSCIGLVDVKSSYNPDAYFDQLSFLRKGVKTSQLPALRPFLPKFYTKNQVISKEKKEDLLSLLPYLPEKYHQFYRDLPTSSTALDVDPDLED